jgi:dolichyl-phosphate-mannose--protein O-mannosyl transferase
VHLLVGRRLPDLATPSGTQDFGRMSREYRDYASGLTPLSPALVWAVTRDGVRNLGTEHLNAPHRRLNDVTENGSAPWHWPFHDRNITYRWDSANGSTAYVELAGNQLAWYSGTLAVFASLLLLMRHRLLRWQPGGRPNTWQLIEGLAVLYLAFMAMSLVYESRRVMYLYHYFPGLLLSYVLLALWWQWGRERSRRFARHGTSVLATVMGLFLLCYLFFLPLSNHVPLTKAECSRRNIWISYVLDCH